jgi:geranylgeranyl diphosphate synthase type II
MHASSSALIREALAETADLVNAALVEFTDFGPGCPRRLADAIRYSLLAPGKRLRPALVLWSADACGYLGKGAMPAACAVEMVHCYSLVHDDLPAMDDDDLRRGRPTLHRAFDEATAILAGDAMLALAFEVLARNVQPPEIAAECCAVLAAAAGPASLVGGQADDLQCLTADGDVATLESIHARKTGAMMRASLQLGGLVAQCTADERTALDTYGAKLGLAFQIADDLLDVRGAESDLGKRVGKDQEHGKLTFPVLLGVDASLERAGDLIDEACAAIAIFGPAAARLEALARYVLERNH